MADFKEIQIDGQVYQVKDETARQSSGGYAPPAGGIPKSDLSSNVQTSLGKADTSLQPSDKTQLQTAIDNVQAAIDAITSGDTTTAIKTFQEVINFLGGVTDNETLIGKLNELRTLINAKANSSDVYTKSQTDEAIQQAIKDMPTGSVESVTINGTKHTPDGNGDVNLGTISKGDKGDTGNVEFEDLADLVALLVNDLTTGGAGNFLSAEMGKRLKQNVDAVQANIVKLYNKLANMAFWNAADKAAAEPTALDWSIPKEVVTITNSIGADAVIKHNGSVVSGTLQVDQGDPLTLTIEAASGKVLTSVAATIDGVAATLTESGGVYTLAIAHVNADMTIVISGQSTTAYNITLNLTNCSKVSGPTNVLGGGSATLVFAADSDYNLPSAQPTVNGASVTSWSAATGELVIGSVTGDVSITIAATFAGWLVAPKNDTSTRYGMQQGRSVHGGMGYMTGGIGSNSTVPSTIVSPAGYNYSQKIYTNAGGAGGTNPGKSTMCFFQTEGKRYLNIKLELNDTELANASSYEYKIAVGCWTSAIINNSYGDAGLTSAIDANVGRVGYATGNVSTYEWKIDLFAFATESGKQAGDIAHIKFLVVKLLNSVGVDTRDWYDNITLKYKFTDD